MAKKQKSLSPKSQRKLLILIALLIAFSAGFLVARARYKPQIRTSFNMVMEREDTIADLEARVKAYEEKMMMLESGKTKIKF